MRQNQRVVITGRGMVGPLGEGVAAHWAGIRAGQSGIRHKADWQAANLGIHIAGDVPDFDPVAHFGKRDARRTDRVTQFAWVAAEEALQDSGLSITDANRTRIGALVGTGLGGILSFLNSYDNFTTRGPRGVSPFVVPRMLPDSAAGHISVMYGLQGPNMALSSACATGNNALGEAASWIQRGFCDAMLAGATESGNMPFPVTAFDNMTALSRQNDHPESASRPFDAHRDGFVMSEGAAILVLESLEHAQARGAHIYGELIGYGMSSDAYHMTAPIADGSGAARAIQMALDSADLTPQDIDYINAHGTSTPLNDAMETRAIKTVFGEAAYTIPVSSTKSMTGHMLGTAGAAEAIFCLQAIAEDFIPPTINLDTPDPDCDLDYVPHTGRAATVRRVMSNAFGFGGHNVVVIFSEAPTDAG